MGFCRHVSRVLFREGTSSCHKRFCWDPAKIDGYKSDRICWATLTYTSARGKNTQLSDSQGDSNDGNKLSIPLLGSTSLASRPQYNDLEDLCYSNKKSHLGTCVNCAWVGEGENI